MEELAGEIDGLHLGIAILQSDVVQDLGIEDGKDLLASLVLIVLELVEKFLDPLLVVPQSEIDDGRRKRMGSLRDKVGVEVGDKNVGVLPRQGERRTERVLDLVDGGRQGIRFLEKFIDSLADLLPLFESVGMAAERHQVIVVIFPEMAVGFKIGDPFGDVIDFLELFLVHLPDEIVPERRDLPAVLHRFIADEGIVDGKEARRLLVEDFDVVFELGAEIDDVLLRALVFRGRSQLGVLESVGKLREDASLARFCGMELETEGIQPDPLETVVDDVECRLLLRDEKNLLPVEKRIGDHVDDRLALSRPGRPEEDEGFSVGAFLDGLDLAGIRDKRNATIALLDGICRSALGPLLPSRGQRFDDGVLFHLVTTIAKIVPHAIVGEIEGSETEVVAIAEPSGYSGDGLFDLVEDFLDVEMSFPVRLDSLDKGEIQAPFLLQKFDERRIEEPVLIPETQVIAFSLGIPDKIDRDEDDGGKAIGAEIVLVLNLKQSSQITAVIFNASIFKNFPPFLIYFY